MAKYGVTCTKIYNGYIEVDADNEQDALDKVNEMWEKGDPIDWTFGEQTADYATKVNPGCVGHHLDWTDKLLAIIEAAEHHAFSDGIDDIDLLSYKKKNANGQKETFEERFDYIDTTSIPISVHFICGTGHQNYSVPIMNLTNDSIDKLYECVLNK